ncbi:hypothetical protein BHE74_00013849 [Ensete ventricosum]|nr:hypothetical protein BHE74_00013849 [Ensete ventricosum]
MEGALGSGSTGRRLAQWSSGRKEAPQLVSLADSCNKVGSGGVLDMTPPMVKSFYSGCHRTFVPEIFNASMACHAVVFLHTVRGPYSEVHVLPTAAVACRPYP